MGIYGKLLASSQYGSSSLCHFTLALAITRCRLCSAPNSFTSRQDVHQGHHRFCPCRPRNGRASEPSRQSERQRTYAYTSSSVRSQLTYYESSMTWPLSPLCPSCLSARTRTSTTPARSWTNWACSASRLLASSPTAVPRSLPTASSPNCSMAAQLCSPSSPTATPSHLI